MSKTLVTRYILFKDKHLKILIIFLESVKRTVSSKNKVLFL